MKIKFFLSKKSIFSFKCIIFINFNKQQKLQLFSTKRFMAYQSADFLLEVILCHRFTISFAIIADF
jgi:hypothetical protein